MAVSFFGDGEREFKDGMVKELMMNKYDNQKLKHK
jgi:hypothetical protein